MQVYVVVPRSRGQVLMFKADDPRDALLLAVGEDKYLCMDEVFDVNDADWDWCVQQWQAEDGKYFREGRWYE